MPVQLYSVGMIARWKPVHVGQAAVLNALCGGAARVFIGIGSSNRYNARNPFTAEETHTMLELALNGQGNVTIIPVPDLDDGPRWRIMVKELFGQLDRFVTANPYVQNLMKNDYRITRPVDWVPQSERIYIDGNMVRTMMAKGELWQGWVPEKVASHIMDHGLDVRFRKEFGLETLALQTIIRKEQ
jgi:nicotinamide-nucleotide adenylyltransferase